MQEFIAKHRTEIAGVLSGFDRLVFRGTLRSLSYVDGMQTYLAINKVLLKDFGTQVQQVSEQLKQASLAEARKRGRPVEYLASPQTHKEARAREIAVQDGVRQGLIGVLTSVELCRSFEIHRDEERKRLHRVPRGRKCLFLYHSGIDPGWGFRHARLPTWFPFPIQVCWNGREGLAPQMTAAGLDLVRQDNGFPWVEDGVRAQPLLEAELRVNGASLRDEVARRLNPAHASRFRTFEARYYWTTYQSEWATDVVFRRAATLRRLYPRLLHHALSNLGSTDVMRYRGRRMPARGEIPKNFQGEGVTDLKPREEGACVRHRVNGNSVKIYDKAIRALGRVLRAEATVHNGDDLRVYRPCPGDPRGAKAWRRMRRGIADRHRRAQVWRRARERYLDALAEVDDETTLQELIRRLGERRRWKGRSVRAWRPFAQDLPGLQAVSRGQFTLNGFRNRDLQRIFFKTPASTPQEARRRTARVGDRLRLLRIHGLIPKVTGPHRSQLTASGRKAITAILTALHSTVRPLIPIAA